MIDVHFELNGRRVRPDQIGDAMEAAILKGVGEKAAEHVRSKLTPAEQRQVTVKVVGDSLDDLSIKISGPDEIVAKLKTALK
jgi:hypothetical protein